MRNAFVLSSALVAILALPAEMSADTPGFGLAQPVPPGTYAVETVAEVTGIPWDVSWLPNGDMLIAEREGQLRLVRNGELLSEPVSGVPEVFVKSQAGLFETAAHPDFAENGWLYLTYAAGTDRRNTLTLARAQYVASELGAELQNLEVLFEAEAYRHTAQHYGGRMVFLEDGTLLLTSGDGYAFRHEAQKLDSHFGKILRLTDSGEVPADNPFIGTDGALPEIYSYGHRNHQGITLTADGTVYANEHGARGGDEINVIEPGQNYGWPFASWGVDYSGSQITPFNVVDETVQPIMYWTPSIAPGAIASYEGELFPDWQGNLFSSGLATREVRMMDPSAPDADQFSLLTELDARVRDVAVGPDGYLYATTETTEGGAVLRITPAS